MIKGNTFYFGYGDIGVGFNCLGLTLQQIKPPVEVGTHLTPEYCKKQDIKLCGEIVVISFSTLGEISALIKLINTVTEGNTIIEYKNYVFDFFHYNKESVEVVKHHLMNPPETFLLPFCA